MGHVVSALNLHHAPREIKKRKLGKENHNGAWCVCIEPAPCAPRNQKKESLAKKTAIGHGASALNLHLAPREIKKKKAWQRKPQWGHGASALNLRPAPRLTTTLKPPLPWAEGAFCFAMKTAFIF